MSAKTQHRHPVPPPDYPHPHLFAIKVALTHTKHRVGKLKNLFNANHRHDEPHEQAVDRERREKQLSHPHESFAPPRAGNTVKSYVDGHDYFWAVSQAIEEARKVIYIEDWWLSPELFLRRPPGAEGEWRLDRLLKRKAQEGVKIYVVVYKEIAQAITCDSRHTKTALQNLCKHGDPGHGNIVVMRHPDHSPFKHMGADMTFYWAHHEKFVVIDHELAFVGGLDLCFGRWDQHQHSLADMHPDGVENEIWPGQDFNNNRILDFQNVNDWKQNQLDKTKYGRMPWHDVSIGFRGPAVMDVAEHFVSRWNFVKRDKYKRKAIYPWLQLNGVKDELIGCEHPTFPLGGYIKHPLHEIGDPTHKEFDAEIQVVRSACDWSHGIEPEEKSIQNAYINAILKAEHFVYIENQFFITSTGPHQAPIQNLVGKAIVDAIIRAHHEKRKFRIIVIIPAIPGFPGDLRDDAAAGTRSIIDYQYKSINRGEHSIHGQLQKHNINPHDYFHVFNLRIFDRINTAKGKHEDYIEAQAKNAADLLSHPNHASPSAATENIQTKIVPDSIACNAMSPDDPTGFDPETPVEQYIQEELYVHSKVLIADDTTLVIGSANINDRSLLGTHDSELSCVVKHHPLVSSLRKKLWGEHLGFARPQAFSASGESAGLPPGAENVVPDIFPEIEQLQDPLNDELWQLWNAQANTNTEVYRKVFACDPDDNIRTWADYEKFKPQGMEAGHTILKDAEEVRAELKKVRGHLVHCPLKFLEEEELKVTGLAVNSWTESIYT